MLRHRLFYSQTIHFNCQHYRTINVCLRRICETIFVYIGNTTKYRCEMRMNEQQRDKERQRKRPKERPLHADSRIEPCDVSHIQYFVIIGTLLNSSVKHTFIEYIVPTVIIIVRYRNMELTNPIGKMRIQLILLSFIVISCLQWMPADGQRKANSVSDCHTKFKRKKK